MGFRLSLPAEEDAIRIAQEGIDLFGPQKARKYHRELFAIFDLISRNPVVYRVEADDDVLIVRVRHGHEDWGNEP